MYKLGVDWHDTWMFVSNSNYRKTSNISSDWRWDALTIELPRLRWRVSAWVHNCGPCFSGAELWEKVTSFWESEFVERTCIIKFFWPDNSSLISIFNQSLFSAPVELHFCILTRSLICSLCLDPNSRLKTIPESRRSSAPFHLAWSSREHCVSKNEKRAGWDEREIGASPKRFERVEIHARQVQNRRRGGGGGKTVMPGAYPRGVDSLARTIVIYIYIYDLWILRVFCAYTTDAPADRLCSVTGKKLMAKCRMLIQENQELGRQLSQGRVAQLEAELALQKKYSEELKTSQDGKN